MRTETYNKAGPTTRRRTSTPRSAVYTCRRARAPGFSRRQRPRKSTRIRPSPRATSANPAAGLPTFRAGRRSWRPAGTYRPRGTTGPGRRRRRAPEDELMMDILFARDCHRAHLQTRLNPELARQQYPTSFNQKQNPRTHEPRTFHFTQHISYHTAHNSIQMSFGDLRCQTESRGSMPGAQQTAIKLTPMNC